MRCAGPSPLVLDHEVHFKENRALRIECTINDTRDFGIGKRLHNLPALREIGFPANRRLLGAQRISCDPTAGAASHDRVCRPVVVDGQRVPALRFDHPATQALLVALVALRLLPKGSPTATCESTSPRCSARTRAP